MKFKEELDNDKEKYRKEIENQSPMFEDNLSKELEDDRIRYEKDEENCNRNGESKDKIDK